MSDTVSSLQRAYRIRILEAGNDYCLLNQLIDEGDATG